MTKREEIKEAIVEGEEVIEMGQGSDGTYKPIAVYKHHNKLSHVPRQTRIPVFYEFIDGFAIGIQAIEHFLRTLDQFGRRR